VKPLKSRGLPRLLAVSKKETYGTGRSTCDAELPCADLQPDGTRKWPASRSGGENRCPERDSDPRWLRDQYDWYKMPDDVELAYWKAWVDIQANRWRAGPSLFEERFNNGEGDE